MQKIPPNFCKHIPWEASTKAKKSLKEASSSMAATLEGPSGRTWPVVIRRTAAEGTFFASGWTKFVQDQALRELDFLVFRHDGGTRFAAMVFDKTACEREDLLRLGEDGPRKKRGRPRKASSRDDTVGKELVPYCGAPGDRQPQVACPNSTVELGSAGQSIAAKTEADTDAHALPLRSNAGPSQKRHGPDADQDGCPAKTRSIQDDLAVAAGIPPSVRRYNGYVSRRRPVTCAERQRATEIARSFRSSLPHCVIRMSTMHVYYSFMMRFPTGFSRQHLPRERAEMALRDPDGKAWAVLYIPNTRDRLSRGWCAFARGNCLEEGDCCVFELVGAAEFRVHIFRVVEPPVPAVRLRIA